MHLFPYKHFFTQNSMCKNVKDTGKSVSFVLKDIDIGGQIQYVMCTGPYFFQSLRSNYPLMDKHAV